MSESIGYRWRRSSRAKQLQVRITPWQGIEVVIPTHTSKQRVRAFLAKQRQWIRATWSEMQSQITDADRGLPEQLNLRALDERWYVDYRQHPGARTQVTVSGRNLIVYQADRDESGCRVALRHWLARYARVRLGAEAQRMSKSMEAGYRRLQIRGQTSRWGSCSSSGTLSLNYKLLFLPPELVRYLLVHELVHTRVLSHAPRFWKLVAQYEPRWRELDKKLGEAWRAVPSWVELK